MNAGEKDIHSFLLLLERRSSVTESRSIELPLSNWKPNVPYYLKSKTNYNPTAFILATIEF